MKKFADSGNTEGEFRLCRKEYLELKNLLPANNEVNFWLGYLYFQKMILFPHKKL
jgi:maltoporin